MPRRRARGVVAFASSPRDAGRRREDVLGDFRNAKFSYAGTTSVFSTRDGKYFVRTDGPDGKLADFEIKYTFGVEPLQQYLIELPGGRLQALGIAWDTRPKAQGGQRWFHLYPDQNLRAGDPLHWTGVNQNWNFMCAECHSTRLAQELRRRRRALRHDVGGDRRRLRGLPRPGRRPRRVGARQARRQARIRPPTTASRSRSTSARASRGRRCPRPATRNAARRERRRAKSTCARAATPAPRASSDDYVHGKPLQDTHRLAHARRGPLLERRPDPRRGLRVGLVRAEQDAGEGRHLLRLPRSALAGAAPSRQRRLRAMPSAGEIRRRPRTRTTRRATPAAECVACHMPTTTYMRIDDAARSFAAHPAPRSFGEARHAERVQRVSREEDAAVGGGRDSRRGPARAPAGFQTFGRSVAGRRRQERPARAAR